MRQLVSFCIILMLSLPAFSGDHQHVAWDALEPGKAYMIRTEVHSQTFYQTPRHGAVRFPSGGFFRIYERAEHEGTLWCSRPSGFGPRPSAVKATSRDGCGPINYGSTVPSWRTDETRSAFLLYNSAST